MTTPHDPGFALYWNGAAWTTMRRTVTGQHCPPADPDAAPSPHAMPRCMSTQRNALVGTWTRAGVGQRIAIGVGAAAVGMVLGGLGMGTATASTTDESLGTDAATAAAPSSKDAASSGRHGDARSGIETTTDRPVSKRGTRFTNDRAEPLSRAVDFSNTAPPSSSKVSVNSQNTSGAAAVHTPVSSAAEFSSEAHEPLAARKALTARAGDISHPTGVTDQAVPLAAEAVDAITVPLAAEAVETIALPTAQLSGVVEAVASLVPASDPFSPISSTLPWTVLATTRRLLGQPQIVATGRRSAAAVATGINQPPVISKIVLSAPTAAAGAVKGTVTASDPNSDALTYKATTSNKGTVSITSAGVFTYTPTAQARHAAAKLGSTPAVTTDTVTVTVTDSKGAVTFKDTTVAVVPSNRAPTATVKLSGTNISTGVVTGSVVGTDSDNDPLSYSAPASTAKGVITISAGNGTFTYTPNGAARHAAAKKGATATDLGDAFTVTVSDGYGGSTPISVKITIQPINRAPSAGKPIIGAPEPSTGAVKGTISATDADNDPLTFSAPTTTARGAVSINATTGAFTYTPTTDARRTAVSGVNGDTFTVTITDGYGGRTEVPVVVAISPQANRAPVIEKPAVGTPDPTSGKVTGSVRATDPDKNTLTFSGSSQKGTVTVAKDGTFSYTPSASARHAAAKEGATQANKTDTFYITVTDGFGGTASQPVTVAIVPKNSAPVVGTPSAKVDATTGIVTGALNVTDSDKDTLTYAISPATSSKGTLSVTTTGSFTYTPTPQARTRASEPTATATDKTDSFVITASDGYGGSVTVPLSVAISPKTSFVPKTTISLGNADPTTGRITGRATSLDADGAAMTFGPGTTSTANGVFSFSADGTFTYTPTAAARHSAAKIGPNTITSDTVSVSVTTSKGTTTTTSVTVPISPQNRAPLYLKTVTNGPTTGTFSGSVVSGYIAISDPDGDKISYQVDNWGAAYGPTRSSAVPTQSGQGKVYFWDGGSGNFVFSYEAKESAQINAYNQGHPGEDVFNVTFTDGYGGVRNVQVQVPIAPYRAY